MSDYSIISNCSEHLVVLLREKMCPEPIPSANNIQVSSPSSQDVDYLVGVYLYDIVEMQDVALGPNIRKGRVRLTRPPRPYMLYYCIFVNGGSQMGLKDLDVQKILGKVVQILNDNDSVRPVELQPWLETPEPPIVFSQAKINLEEKHRVWSALHKPYNLSLFFKAGPVFLSSEDIIVTPEVVEAEFNIDMKSKGKR